MESLEPVLLVGVTRRCRLEARGELVHPLREGIEAVSCLDQTLVELLGHSGARAVELVGDRLDP